jgi:hypothetical protein
MKMCEKCNVGTYKIVETLETIGQRQHSTKLDHCNNRMRQVLDKAGTVVSDPLVERTKEYVIVCNGSIVSLG